MRLLQICIVLMSETDINLLKQRNRNVEYSLLKLFRSCAKSEDTKTEQRQNRNHLSWGYSSYDNYGMYLLRIENVKYFIMRYLNVCKMSQSFMNRQFRESAVADRHKPHQQRHQSDERVLFHYVRRRG